MRLIILVVALLALSGCCRKKGEIRGLTADQEKELKEKLTLGGLGPGKDLD